MTNLKSITLAIAAVLTLNAATAQSAGKRYTPAKPTNVKAKCVTEGDKKFVVVTFKGEKNPKLKGWRLLSKNNEGKWVEEIGNFTGDTIRKEHKDYLDKGKVYAVRGISKGNYRGPISDSVKVLCGGQFMQRVKPSWRWNKEDASLILEWTYDLKKYPELEGFQVFHGDRMIADEKELGMEATSYKVTGLDYGKTNFSVVAVSKFGTKSEKIPVSAFIRKNWVE